MIKTRHTSFEIDVREVADPNTSREYAMEVVRPWLDELEKDDLRWANIRFQVQSDISQSDPWKARLTVWVDTQVEASK